MKISVLTACKNAAPTIERAIASVQSQDYTNWEHVVEDGASTDGTVELLNSHHHLKLLSKPDLGQSDALQNAFERSTGDIIVCLNADDYFLPGAFSAVVKEFEKGAKFVVGNVLVKSERGRFTFINRPRTELERMLKHWERNAFCYNPVGYFYHRQVQIDCPFNRANSTTMDLEFLLAARKIYNFSKIEKVLGCYNDSIGTKTQIAQVSAGYWTESSFPYIDQYLADMSAHQKNEYMKARETGYRRLARYWRRKEKIGKILAKFKSVFSH